jgi:mycothiol synthase
MEAFTHRPYNEQIDHHRIDELLVAFRAATRVDVYPTIWRLHLLLSSRIWEPPLNTRIWEGAAGELVGFALLWRRRAGDTYLVLEQFLHPLSATAALADAILEWAVLRAKTLAQYRAMPLTLYATEPDPLLQIDGHLPTYGFVPTPPDPDIYSIYFERSLQNPCPQLLIPEGYTIRPLQSTDELSEYHALYGFAAVTAEHQQLLLMADEYRHLVVVNPVGHFVAYCECSVYRKEWQASSQHIGWIDYIGTKKEYQQQGFGKAILLAGLEQLRAWGTEIVMLVTISNNAPAIRLYENVGFTRKNIPERSSYEMSITPMAER